jgi:peptidyl-prolyl isomerase H (cyclophilin H)
MAIVDVLVTFLIQLWHSFWVQVSTSTSRTSRTTTFHHIWPRPPSALWQASIEKRKEKKRKKIRGLQLLKTPTAHKRKPLFPHHHQKRAKMATITENPTVFFDITLGGEPLGRIKMLLYADKVPRTAENFRQFCTGETKNHLGRPQGYKNCRFHRVIRDFINGDGTGSATVYGTREFADEKAGLELRHDEVGVLSMAVCLTFMSLVWWSGENDGLDLVWSDWLTFVYYLQNSGPNTNGCQFFILTAPAPHLNGKHAVFGKVVEGLDVVRKIENVRTRDEKPVQEVSISMCGEMWDGKLRLILRLMLIGLVFPYFPIGFPSLSGGYGRSCVMEIPRRFAGVARVLWMIGMNGEELWSVGLSVFVLITQWIWHG